MANFAMMIADLASRPEWREPPESAEAAAARHQELCGPVIDLLDDDNFPIGLCCSECDWQVEFEPARSPASDQ